MSKQAFQDLPIPEATIVDAAAYLSEDESKTEDVINSTMEEEREPFSFHCVDLWYDPPKNYVKIFDEESRFFLNQYIPRRYVNALPHIVSETSQHAPLNSVTFSAFPGQITAILSDEMAERRSIIDLIINRRFSGLFDGHVFMRGVARGTHYDDNIAFVHRKAVFLPGLTYKEMLRYAARLRMKNTSLSSITTRVDRVLQLMDLVHCQDRKIVEHPPQRGVQGGELRRLSIAIEIVSLPPLLVVEDPALALEPAVAASIFNCLRALAENGHCILLAMARPSAQIFAYFDRIVVVGNGHSIYAAETSRAEPYFCSQEMGYAKKSEVFLVDFLMDIAKGTERPLTHRDVQTPALLQEKFESSDFFLAPPIQLEGAAHGLPEHSYTHAFWVLTHTRLCNCKNWPRLAAAITASVIRGYIVVERAFFVKIMDFETIKKNIIGAGLIGTIVGYIQFGCGNYGYYATTMLTYPYPDTANTTAVLFFLSAFSFGINILVLPSLVQKLQLFRYEQFTGVSNAVSFLLATAISDIPFTIANIMMLSTIIYFMTQMNFGVDNFIYYSYVVVLNGLVGLASLNLFAAILKKEIPVRDMFLFNTFLMIMLSGFAFQLPFVRSYLADVSEINPMRWTFEALLHWKFATYEDGLNYLIPFSFATFQSYKIFRILAHFIIFSVCTYFLLLVQAPYTLTRQSRKGTSGERSQSRDSVESGELADVVRAPTAPVRVLERPLLFTRETSITQKSQLSINVSQSSVGPAGAETPSIRGPTVTFHNVTYRVRDRFSPLGVKNILLNVSGQFDWGKLSMVLGASMSGRSSLLHILGGDLGFQSEVTGQVLFDGKEIDPMLKLWQRCGLVEAQDEQHRDITVNDVVTYAMKLRCPNKSFFNIVESNVQKTLDLLHLNDIRDRKTKNLSKGERRRLSIAEEIVHGPYLLLIDEPTTNLDLHDTSVMMQTFREMVNQDRTVVASVQNPTASVFNLFDTVLLLSKGRVIFCGPTLEAAPYFINSPYGYTLVKHRNPAEFLIDISGGLLACNNGDILAPAILDQMFRQDQSKKQTGFGSAPMTFSPMPKSDSNPMLDVEVGGQRSPSSSMDLESPVANAAGGGIVCPSIVTVFIKAIADFFSTLAQTDYALVLLQTEVLFQRSFFALFNRKKLVLANLILHVCIAAFLGWILGPSSDLVYNLTSFFAVSTLLLYFGNVQVVYFLFTNHQVFLKEHSRGLYSTYLYWLITQIPMYFIRACSGIIFAVISYALLVLGKNVDKEGFFVLTSMVTILAGHMVCEFIVFAVKDIVSAYMAMLPLYFIFFAFSGLFVKPSTLPNWISPWAPSFSIIRWTMQADFINYFDGATNLFPVLPIANPYTVFLSLFGWGGKTKWYCLGMIAANVGVYKFLSLIAAGYTSLSQKGGRAFKKIEAAE